MNPESTEGEGKDNTVFSGIVVTGSRRAAFFTRLDWVKTQCLNQFGFEPYPGTLNIRLAVSDEEILTEIFRHPHVLLHPPDDTYCQSRALPVRIGSIPGALILPQENVRVHGREILEILAPVSLRETLHLQDGDRVSFTLETPVLENNN